MDKKTARDSKFDQTKLLKSIDTKLADLLSLKANFKRGIYRGLGAAIGATIIAAIIFGVANLIYDKANDVPFINDVIDRSGIENILNQ